MRERRVRVNYLVHAYSLITRRFSIGRIALVQMLCWGAPRSGSTTCGREDTNSIRASYQRDWWQRTARVGTPLRIHNGREKARVAQKGFETLKITEIGFVPPLKAQIRGC